ncbi:MAG: ribosome maturation factor RimM [Thermodesulfobacteriota bacterium]|nr:ribosome maturation factor RimM [Thermodesulfobacteriota bacterium]
MTPATGDALLFVGQVVKTQGIKGQVRVSSAGGETTAFPAGSVVYFKNKQGMNKSLTVASSRAHRQTTILSFREVRRIEEAEELVGCSVYVAKETLPALPEGEFYWYQLIGLEVQTEKGVFLGTLEEILPTGSNDVFVVRKDHQEYLLPATDEVVVRVDLQGKTMVIRPLEGLLPEDDL